MNAKEAASVLPGRSTYGKRIPPALFAGLLRAFDLCIVFATGLGIFLVYLAPDRPWNASSYVATTLIGSVLAGLFFEWARLYSEDRIFSGRLQIGRTLVAWTIACGLLLVAAFAFKLSATFSRVWVVGWYVSAAGLLMLGRVALGRLILQWAREGRLATRTVIFGAGEQGRRLAASIGLRGDPRTLILGFIDDRRSRIPPRVVGHDVLGDLDHLINLVRSNSIDQVLIALPWNADQRIAQLIHRLSATPVHIRLAPDLAALTFGGREFVETGGLPMLRLLDRPISGWSYVWKRLEDHVLAATGLVFAAPLMALIAVAIKLDSRGPVLFRQKRYGFNHQLIEVWKFRTMYADATDPNAEVLATRDDDRVTRLGRWLRRSSLDELPQLLNVIRGDMSLVGPRPHALAAKAEGQLYQEVVDSYAARHRVKPGITGWAQVNGWRGETDTIEKIQKRVECDLFYIDNWSVWLDLTILARTVLALMKGENAY